MAARRLRSFVVFPVPLPASSLFCTGLIAKKGKGRKGVKRRGLGRGGGREEEEEEEEEVRERVIRMPFVTYSVLLPRF